MAVLVPIFIAKYTKIHAFDPRAPEIKYVQDDKNNCVFGTLDSALFDVKENVSKHAVVSLLPSSLSCGTVGFMNRTAFVGDILIDRMRNQVKQLCRYNIVHCKNKVLFGISNYISDHVTLVQLEY